MLIGIYNVHETVIEMIKRKKCLSDDNIGKSVELILKNYSNEGLRVNADAIDYDDVKFRLAYIYLYGTSHVHLTYSCMSCFKSEAPSAFFEWLGTDPFPNDIVRQMNLLSIGGGPGTDLVGVLLFLQAMVTDVNCNVVDHYQEWEELLWRTLHCLDLPNFFYEFNVSYEKENLLEPLSQNMKKLLKQADLVTMSKFVSAISASNSAAYRLRQMFSELHKGALVYFVDNAGGEAFRMGERVAAASGLVPVWGPIYHHQFRIQKEYEPMDDVLANPRFAGIRPQTSTKVSIVIWKKVSNVTRGLKRTRTNNGYENCHLSEDLVIKRPRFVSARRRIPAHSTRLRSRTTPMRNRHPINARHRRVASENVNPRRQALVQHGTRRVVTLVNKENSDANVRTPKMARTKETMPVVQSPYSFSDTSFNVPITPMVRRKPKKR